jgi:hypothetical protein
VQAKKGGMDGKKRKKITSQWTASRWSEGEWEALMLGEALVKLEESRISKK